MMHHRVYLQVNAIGWIIDDLVHFLWRYVTLWPRPLTHRFWTFVVHPVSCVQTRYKISAKSCNPRLRYWRRFGTYSSSNF